MPIERRTSACPVSSSGSWRGHSGGQGGAHVEARGDVVSFDLSGTVALVAGASKGIGRGIALELGACGATVYLTGRTMAATADNPGLLSAVDEIGAEGGHGVALACDHRDDAQ